MPVADGNIGGSIRWLWSRILCLVSPSAYYPIRVAVDCQAKLGKSEIAIIFRDF